MTIDGARIEALAREIASREAGRVDAVERARLLAGELHSEVAAVVSRFAAAARRAGAPHLDLVTVGPVEPDDKSIRAFQFKIRRGRFEAIVVTKDRGEVMLVGPFKRGEAEGPCNPIRQEGRESDRPGIETNLETLLVALIEMSFQK
ncbi:MAG TPA: hypothetical protein VGK94_02280 [Candidatus Polarisedimenticolia bacterium]